MGEVKQDLDVRNRQWEFFWDFRGTLNEKSEAEVVKQCIKVLDNALSFLLTHKLVEREWTAILGDNGLLNDIEKKAAMAKGLGLLTNHHTRLLKQIQQIQQIFEVSAEKGMGFEDEPVSIIASQFVFPENTYLPRRATDDGSEGYIRWNPLELAKNTRARFLYVVDFLYFDFLNRTTFFNVDSPIHTENVSLSTVLTEQEALYLNFIGDTRRKEAEVALELKIAQQTETYLQEEDKYIHAHTALMAMMNKKESIQKDIERLQEEAVRLVELKRTTTESWENHQKNFAWIVKEVAKKELKKNPKFT